MSEDLAGQAKDLDQDFIRVSCHALATSVCEEAIGWVRSISQTMREMYAATLAGLRDRIAKFSKALHKKPDTLDELKSVLNTVNIIRNEHMAMELKYADLEERYRTRLLYAQPDEVEQCGAELTDASSIRGLWQDLVDEADRVDYSLEATKELFSETTRKQVTDFLAFTEELLERFKSSGPGLPTIELPVGLDLLKEYQLELEGATKTREQLVLAEKLFDMPITSYPMLSQVEAEVKKLTQVWLLGGRGVGQQALGQRGLGRLLV